MVRMRKLMLAVLFDSIRCEDVILCDRKIVFILIIFLLELWKAMQAEDIASILQLLMLFQGIV
jgi:hypothetical protein